MSDIPKLRILRRRLNAVIRSLQALDDALVDYIEAEAGRR
jgi:hypothetical protein